MRAEKLLLETAWRRIVLETDPDRMTHYRLRHRGRPLVMYLERFRRQAPSARRRWKLLEQRTRVEWLPLLDVFTSPGNFRHEGSICLEPEGFEDVPWRIGYRDEAGTSHLLRFEFNRDTTHVLIRWYEVPDGISGPSPFTRAEVVAAGLHRTPMDLPMARKAWAALTPDERKKFRWQRVTKNLLREHEFEGALELFGPVKPREMSSNGAIRAFELLYTQGVKSPRLEPLPTGVVRVGGVAPNAAAKQAVIDALSRDGYWLEDELTVLG